MELKVFNEYIKKVINNEIQSFAIDYKQNNQYQLKYRTIDNKWIVTEIIFEEDFLKNNILKKYFGDVFELYRAIFIDHEILIISVISNVHKHDDINNSAFSFVIGKEKYILKKLQD